jgi:hypothetical protein
VIEATFYHAGTPLRKPDKLLNTLLKFHASWLCASASDFKVHRWTLVTNALRQNLCRERQGNGDLTKEQDLRGIIVTDGTGKR